MAAISAGMTEANLLADGGEAPGLVQGFVELRRVGQKLLELLQEGGTGSL